MMLALLSETLTESTPVAIGLVIVVIGTIVGAAWKVANALTGQQTALTKHANESKEAITELAHKFELLKEQVNGKLDRIEERAEKKVTHNELRSWILQLRAVFPDKAIPMFEPEDGPRHG